MLRVFVTHNDSAVDTYLTRALPPLSSVADVVVNETGQDLTTADLIEAAHDCQVIVALGSVDTPADIFRDLPRLLAFLTLAADTDHIDMRAASRAGVLVACGPEPSDSDPDGDHALAAAGAVHQVAAHSRREMPERAVNPGMATRLKVLWDLD
jgi:phosphoglycerate dehydrogenase-like enzyme